MAITKKHFLTRSTLSTTHRLEREVGRNVEVMWLSGRLVPITRRLPISAKITAAPSARSAPDLLRSLAPWTCSRKPPSRSGPKILPWTASSCSSRSAPIYPRARGPRTPQQLALRLFQVAPRPHRGNPAAQHAPRSILWRAILRSGQSILAAASKRIPARPLGGRGTK